MRTFPKLAMMIATLLVLVAGPVGAQDQTGGGGGWLRAPVFLAQPGVVTANAISAPGDADAIHGFNVRFATLVPTATPFFNIVAGVQFQPNGLGGNGNNQPGFFYGAVIPIGLFGAVTGGWISLSIDPLGVYAPAGYGDRPYSHEFFIEAAFTANVGQKLIPTTSPWSGIGVYFLVDQQITHAPLDEDGDRDYWNPVLLYGVSLPIAPWGS